MALVTKTENDKAVLWVAGNAKKDVVSVEINNSKIPKSRKQALRAPAAKYFITASKARLVLANPIRQ